VDGVGGPVDGLAAKAGGRPARWCWELTLLRALLLLVPIGALAVAALADLEYGTRTSLYFAAVAGLLLWFGLRRWFQFRTLEVIEVTDHGVTISGAAEEFAAALAGWRLGSEGK